MDWLKDAVGDASPVKKTIYKNQMCPLIVKLYGVKICMCSEGFGSDFLYMDYILV